MDSQTADHTLKGSITGLLAYLLSRLHVEPSVIALLTPVIVMVLGELSKRVGVKGIASFFEKW